MTSAKAADIYMNTTLLTGFATMRIIKRGVALFRFRPVGND